MKVRVKGMTLRTARLAAILSLPMMLLSVAVAVGADPSPSLSAAGWEERTSGYWSSVPRIKAEANGNRLSAEFALPPGSGVSWSKKVALDNAAGGILAFEFSSDGTNSSSRDYKEFRTRFPVSVTVVFGKDSQELGWRTRFLYFFRKIRHGFPPGGIRLVYAWGNQVPVGSMYRTGEEETVFILAGEEDKGKTVRERRNLREDFMAAYGRYPSGPVTSIIVGAARPSGEKEQLMGRVVLTLPGP
ncbi:MAG: DUF3047 domain-containing protein [Deltaproteobacteria bacterium]|nr:DUF3047 domain-containing protein [Deltaproteobacteria bacterium]